MKPLEEIAQTGRPTGVFRIVFKRGKIYNFMDRPEGGTPQGQAFQIVKKKLGK